MPWWNRSRRLTHRPFPVGTQQKVIGDTQNCLFRPVTHLPYFGPSGRHRLGPHLIDSSTRNPHDPGAAFAATTSQYDAVSFCRTQLSGDVELVKVPAWGVKPLIGEVSRRGAPLLFFSISEAQANAYSTSHMVCTWLIPNPLHTTAPESSQSCYSERLCIYCF